MQEEVFRNFFGSEYSNDAADYACIIDRGGRKHFTYKGRRIPKAAIPSSLLSEVVGKAQDKRQTLEEDELEKLQLKMEALRVKMEALEKKIEEQKAKVEEKRKNPPPPPPPKQKKEKRKRPVVPPREGDGVALLHSLGIRDKKDWKLWLLRNHPDRNTNVDPSFVGLVNSQASILLK